MIFQRSELVDSYSGPDNLPGQWKTVEAVASDFEISPDEVRTLFRFYKIAERDPEDEIQTVLWNVLVNEWFFEYITDFNYMVRLFQIMIYFHLVTDGIGFNLDSKVPPKTLAMDHIHGVNIYRLNPNIGSEQLAEAVRKILKDNNVSKRSRKYGKPKGQTTW